MPNGNDSYPARFTISGNVLGPLGAMTLEFASTAELNRVLNPAWAFLQRLRASTFFGLILIAPCIPVLAHDIITTKLICSRDIAQILEKRCTSCYSVGALFELPKAARNSGPLDLRESRAP